MLFGKKGSTAEMKNKYLKKAICIVLVMAAVFTSVLPAFAKESETTGVIFIGDSRTVGMNNVVNMSNMSDTYVVAKVGKGYKWYQQTGQYEVANIKNEHPHDKWIYVFNLGVNDLGNIEKYQALIDEMEVDNTVYTVSVNPVIDSKSRNVKNNNIERFNEQLQAAADNYIDTYSYLVTNGFNSSDGLHYGKSTYETIYSLIQKGVDEENGVSE